MLPDLPSGVYRHYKGPLYFVFGYGHDANAETLADLNNLFSPSGDGRDNRAVPMRERTVVVYMALELTDAHTGPRLAVRTAEDFHAWVHSEDGSVCRTHVGDTNLYCFCDGGQEQSGTVRRFTYIGPTWEGSS